LISNSQGVFAVDLVLAAIDRVTADPNINVPDARRPIITAGFAVIFMSQVLAEMVRVDDFADVQLGVRSGQCEGIAVCAGTASEAATALRIGYSGSRRGIVRITEVCLFDIVHLLALAVRRVFWTREGGGSDEREDENRVHFEMMILRGGMKCKDCCICQSFNESSVVDDLAEKNFN
jgi:hypothetical protein